MRSRVRNVCEVCGAAEEPHVDEGGGTTGPGAGGVRGCLGALSSATAVGPVQGVSRGGSLMGEH